MSHVGLGFPDLPESGSRLAAGAPPLPNRHGGPKLSATPAERAAERTLAERAEAAYRRPLAD